MVKTEHGNALRFALLCVAAGIFCAQPIHWTLPSSFLRGASAAAGLAVINLAIAGVMVLVVPAVLGRRCRQETTLGAAAD